MPGEQRIRIDPGNILKQVARLKDAGTRMGEALSGADNAIDAVGSSWQDDAGRAFLRAQRAMTSEAREDLDTLLSLPSRFAAWIEDWASAQKRAAEAARHLPD